MALMQFSLIIYAFVRDQNLVIRIRLLDFKYKISFLVKQMINKYKTKFEVIHRRVKNSMNFITNTQLPFSMSSCQNIMAVLIYNMWSKLKGQLLELHQQCPALNIWRDSGDDARTTHWLQLQTNVWLGQSNWKPAQTNFRRRVSTTGAEFYVLYN